MRSPATLWASRKVEVKQRERELIIKLESSGNARRCALRIHSLRIVTSAAPPVRSPRRT